MVRSILLRGFDQDCANMIGDYMERHHVKFARGMVPEKFEKVGSQTRVYVDGKVYGDYDTVLLAIGRKGCAGLLNLEAAGVNYDASSGKIKCENEQTNVPHIYAVGDVLAGLPELTPVTMFKNTYQSGFLSILYSIGSKPLQIWDKVRNGHIKRLTDADIQSSVLEIMGTNVSTTYITCPADPNKVLGIKLPFLVMIIKNLKKYFTFEVTVLDDKEVRRRFRASNYQSTTRVKPFICTMPMRLDEGWNQIQFNLSDFTRRAYGTNYIEALRVQLHANCRIRRIYFSDRLYSEEELPPEFKLFLPVQQKAQAAAAAAAGPTA